MTDPTTKADQDHPRYAGLETAWHEWAPGAGQVHANRELIRLSLHQATADRYSDAQLDDYGADGVMRWRPPLRLKVQARYSGDGRTISGTAGFGFWNDPGGTLRRGIALPRALWFFYASPPSNIALDSLVPGWGWKAMTIDASRWPFLAMLPFAPLAIPLMWGRWLRRALWPVGQWALGVREAPVHAPMDQWHTYQIDWLPGQVHFQVDGVPLLQSNFSPRGPLGLVIWLDNQYAIVTPGGRIGGGLLAAPGQQSLEIRSLSIHPISI